MPVEVILPKVDMAMETGSIEAWKVSEGDVVREGDLLFEIGTDKSVMEVEAPTSGTIRHIAAQTGTQIPVGTVVAMIYREGEAVSAAPAAAAPAAPAPGADASAPASAPTPADAPAAAAAPAGQGVRATPLARRIARQNGIDLAAVSGSGPRGRIGQKDVEAAIAARAPGQSATVPATAPASPRPAAAAATALPEGGRLEPFSPIRRIVADRLAESMRTSPHFYMTAHIDMSALISLQKRIAPRIEARTGLKPSLTVLLARVVGPLLMDHPVLNASVEGQATRYRDGAHIGIAMDRNGELVVPVLRDCHRLSLAELTERFAALRDQVRDRSIPPSAMRGGTFTISNLGMYGVDGFTAIINPPEAAILAVGRTVDTPVGVNGKVKLRPVATFTLSSDHRIVDGVAAARFMQDLRSAVETPELLL